MNSLGFVEIARDGMELRWGEGRVLQREGYSKEDFQPPMIAVLVGFLLVMLNVRLPVFLSSALSYIGDVTSPLALMFVGMILQRTGISRIRKFDKGISWALVGRYLVSPLAMLGITALWASRPSLRGAHHTDEPSGDGYDNDLCRNIGRRYGACRPWRRGHDAAVLPDDPHLYSAVHLCMIFRFGFRRGNKL